MGTQDHLQAKIWPLQAGGMGSDDNLPPGFEFQPANPWAAKLSQISLVKWKCPQRVRFTEYDVFLSEVEDRGWGGGCSSAS